MKRYILLIILTFAVSVSGMFAQPKLKIVEGDTYNWNEVKPKQNPLKAKIHLTNVGNQTLEIKEVKPTCGCTTAPLDKNSLKPGDTATLDVTLNVSTKPGKVHKTIRISTNDATTPMKVLGLEADIVTAIDFVPASYLTFSQMQIGVEGKASVKIVNKTSKDIVISDIESQPDIMSINLGKKAVLKANSEIELIAKVKPVKSGYFNCTVKMKTNHPDHPDITITGYGNVTESPVFNNTK